MVPVGYISKGLIALDRRLIRGADRNRRERIRGAARGFQQGYGLDHVP